MHVFVRFFVSLFCYVASKWVSCCDWRKWPHFKYNDVTFAENNGQTELYIEIRSSKTDQKRHSVTLVLQKHSDLALCPNNVLQSFTLLRFSGLNGSNKLCIHFPLTKYQFCSILQKSLSFCEVQFHIGSHSFRIGRATDLAKWSRRRYYQTIWALAIFIILALHPFLSPGIIIFIFLHVLSNRFCFLPDLMYWNTFPYFRSQIYMFFWIVHRILGSETCRISLWGKTSRSPKQRSVDKMVREKKYDHQFEFDGGLRCF